METGREKWLVGILPLIFLFLFLIHPQSSVTSTMEPEWEKFLFLVHDNKESLSSPAYQLVMKHFPLQFVRKLMDTIKKGSMWEIKHQAMDLLDYVFDDVVGENYANMERRSIEHLERAAMTIPMVNDDDPYILDKVKRVVRTLLELSIEENKEWKDFIKLAGQSFIATDDRFKEQIIEIFVHLTTEHQEFICKRLGPDFVRLHAEKLTEMFDAEEDETPFYILRALCNTIPIDQLTLLMEAATKAPLFWGGKSVAAWKRCLAGSTLCYCITHRKLRFSTEMSHKIQNVIFLMLKSEEEDVRSIGVQLCAALLHDALTFRLETNI